MKKIFKYIMFLTIGVLATACTYDESELGGQLDDIKDRIEKIQGDITALNTQLGSLNEIANGNAVIAVEKDSEGNCVIKYLDNNNEEKSVVIAAMNYMVSVPMLGVKQENETSPYYWTLTDGGEETWLLLNGEKVPVSGFAPDVTVDAEGYWTIEGNRIKDMNGNDLYAHDDTSCLFKSIETDENGDLVITQGSGNTITIPVQSSINLTLSAGVNTPVINTANPVKITYEVKGANAEDAIVAIADASGLSATIDRETKTITVSFTSAFQSGHLVVVAYDLEEHTVIRPVFFSTNTGGGGEGDEPLDYYPIYNAQDLVAFAAAVNAGTGMESMDAKLMNDIDMSSVTSWTPIGHCAFTWASNELTITSGTPYKAHFDGQGYVLKGFKMNCTNDTEGRAYGMFGTLSEGAVVENFKFDANSSFTMSPTASTDAGLVAGLVNESTVKNITSLAPMTYTGNSSAPAKRMTMAMVGFAFANTNPVTIDNLVNKGNIECKNSSDHNLTAGATAVHVAGIVGFSTNHISSTQYITVSNCTNDGNLDVDCARASGIVAAANRYTSIDYCTNNGDQINSFNKADGARAGNITCITNVYSRIRNTTNNGDIISTTDGRIGGILSLVSAKTCEFENVHNKGNVISDRLIASSNACCGLFFGMCKQAAPFTNCSVAGSVGTYNGGSYDMKEVTPSNYLTQGYVGLYDAVAVNVTSSNIRYVGENAVGIKSAADLVEFATLVNAGESYAKFQDEAGGVNLLNDIDMSSVTSWTPIGYATCPAGANDAEITGNAFTGRFSGNNFKIKNLKMVASGAEADKNYGFFGTLAPGATVENIVFDESCSLEVTATAKKACGVVAGYVYDATVRDVQSYAKMTFNGKAGDNVFMSMAVIGQVYCNTQGVTVDSVHNYGDIVANNSDNTKSGATAYHAAGIVGFAHALQDSEKINTISSCSNYGNMTSQLARTSGIVAAANRNTEIFNCENNGDQVNSFFVEGGARLGNITCLTSNSCSVTGCKNFGDLICTNGGRPGGIVSLPNSVTFTNCANYGVILSDEANRGLFYGYNGANSVWINCIAGGKVGTYNNNSPVYDSYSEAEKETYLGKYNSSKEQTYTNITYLIGTTDPSAGTGEEAEYNILFIGNSFTKDAVEHLPGLLAGAGNAKVNMTHIYYGGQFISTYNAKFSDAAGFTCYTCKPGALGWSNATGISIEDCCNAAEWDIVTIQEHTGNWCAWDFTSTSESDVKSLVNKINATQKDAPKYYYIMSQAYHNMAKIGTASRPYITWEDQEGMYDVIVEFGKDMMNTGLFEGIIATGTMLQNLRTSSLNTSMDLTRDGYHMDNGIARYGAACTVFETIITPKFSSTMDGNTFRYDVTNTSETQYTTPVTSANAPIAIQAARYAIQKPYQITDMSSKEDNSVGNMDYDEGTKE